MIILWKVIYNNVGLILLLNSYWREYYVIIKYVFWEFFRFLEKIYNVILNIEEKYLYIEKKILEIVFFLFFVVSISYFNYLGR